MGSQAFQQIRQEQKVSNDRNAQRYVQCVTNAITGQLQADAAGWEVVVFEDDSANAFALPGKKIGVHTGLLALAENQDQLASVVAHEIGHVLSRHGAERVSQQFAAGTAMQMIDAYVGQNSPESSKLAMALLGLGTQVGVLLPYNRLQESEADIIGLDLMARAGFDPRQAIDLWENMSSQGASRPPEFLSTHPAPASRIRELRERMPQAMQLYQQTSSRPRCG
jgi:predicted Zn-dependent protease